MKNHVGRNVAVAALFLTLLSGRAAAQQEEGEDRPAACLGWQISSGWVQGQWFPGVRQVKQQDVASNVAIYVNVEDKVISYNKRWAWLNGGGMYSCHESWVPFVGWLYYTTLVPPSDGVLVPVGEATDDPPPPPPQGGGTSSADILTELQLCRYEVYYNRATGEVYWMRELFCY